MTPPNDQEREAIIQQAVAHVLTPGTTADQAAWAIGCALDSVRAPLEAQVAALSYRVVALEGVLYPMVVECLMADANEDLPEFAEGEPYTARAVLPMCRDCGGTGATNLHDYEDLEIPPEFLCRACEGWGFLKHDADTAAAAQAHDAAVRAPLEQENDEQHALIMRQSDLLRGVANALHGGPLEDGYWSHHDLPELAVDARSEGYAAGVAAASDEEADRMNAEAADADAPDPALRVLAGGAPSDYERFAAKSDLHAALLDAERRALEAAERLSVLREKVQEVIAHEVMAHSYHRQCISGCVLCDLAKAERATETSAPAASGPVSPPRVSDEGSREPRG